MTRLTLYLVCGAVFLTCGPAMAQHAEQSEGSGNLFSGTLGDSLWAVLAFVVLLVVLGKYAWKPLLDGLSARQEHIEQQLKSAEDSRVRAEHLLDEYQQQGLTLVREATEQAQRYQRQAVEKTREETLAIRRRSHEEIASARASAVEELWKQTGDIVLQVSGEVLGRALTEQDNQRLIDEAVARIRQNGGLQ